MQHPAKGQSYCITYTHPRIGQVQAWQTFYIRNLETAQKSFEDSIADLQEKFPGIKYQVLWLNNDRWQEVSLGNKYSLFSED